MAEAEESSYHCVNSGAAGVLGAYGGIDVWTINARLLPDPVEQAGVSLHERLHRSLQHGTPWGLLARFAADLARHGVRTDQFTRLSRFCREQSRSVHETYATTLTLGGESSAARTLHDNVEYRDYLDNGMALTAGLGWERGRFLVDLVLRACMAAGALDTLASRGVAGLRIADLDRAGATPDDRLAQVLRVASDLPRDAIAEVGVHSSADELGVAYDHIAAHLTAHGLPTLRTGEVRSIVELLCQDVTELAPAVGRRITVNAPPDPSLDRAEEFQAESILLDDETGPLPLEIVPMHRLDERAADFTRDDDRLGKRVLLVWARTDLLARQFAGPNPLTGQRGFTLALQASGRDEEGRVVARLGLFDGVQAGDVVRAFGLPVVFFTTMASIVDTPEDLGFAGIDTVYALVDQPAAAQLVHTFAQGATIRWHTYVVTGDRRLHVVAWKVSALPGTVWLHVVTETGAQVICEWLTEQPAEHAIRDPEALAPESDGISVVVEHLVGTWSIIDQDGGRTHG